VPVKSVPTKTSYLDHSSNQQGFILLDRFQFDSGEVCDTGYPGADQSMAGKSFSAAFDSTD